MDEFTIIALEKRNKQRKKAKAKYHIPYQLYRKFLFHKCPIRLEKVKIYNEIGNKVYLPFTKEDLERYDESFIEDYICRVVQRYDFKHLYYGTELRNVVFDSPKGWIFKYLFFDEMFEKTLKRYRISKEKVRLVVIDSEDGMVKLILQQLIKGLNYLTIVTERPEYYEEFCAKKYEEDGLAVAIQGKTIEDSMEGNVIVDFSIFSQKYYRYFQENSIVFEFSNHKRKLEHIRQMKDRLHIIYDITVKIGREKVNNDLASVILCSADERIEKLVNERLDSISIQSIQDIKRLFGIHFENVNVL